MTAPARAVDCVKSTDGASVTCTTDGFGLLTREAISARGEAISCSIRLKESQSGVVNREALLTDCEARLSAIKPCPPPPDTRRPLTAYAVGVVSSALLVGGILLPIPDAARYALSGAGLTGLAGGVVLLVW